MRRGVVPVLVALSLSSTAARAEASTVSTDEVTAMRAFTGHIDVETIDSWSASTGAAPFMPYDEVHVTGLSDDGKELTVSLKHNGLAVRAARLSLEEELQPDATTHVVRYKYDELNVYNRFELKIDMRLLSDADGTPVASEAAIATERAFTMTPVYDARAKAIFRPAP